MTTGFEPYPAPPQRAAADDLAAAAGAALAGHPGPPSGGPRVPSSGPSDVAYPVAPGPRAYPIPTHSRRGGLRQAALVVTVVALAAVVAVQAYRLHRLDGRLVAADQALAQAQAAEQRRLSAVDGRVTELERLAQRAFDSEAVSTAVLPSVFRVRAGRFTGTAFAVSKRTADGRTNLITNFHVVEAVWSGGGRKVTLERRDETMTARIAQVDRRADLARLTVTKKLPGLAAVSDKAKPGQPVVVVGAPLGLEDTVTTGVISAVRDDEEVPQIQFDAPINPGNSGGPVVNAAKQVVGIATAKARDAEGIGLAVPIEQACRKLKVC